MSIFHRPDDETLRRQGIHPEEYTGLLIQFWLAVAAFAVIPIGLIVWRLT